MVNDINDELILAARLLLATLFLIFGWRKLRDYSGTVSQMVQLGVPMSILATVVSIFMELRGGCWRVHTSFGCTLGFIRVGNCAYWASLLDSERCGSSRQHGGLLQRPQHYGRLLAVVHYWCGKIFDRCIVRHRRAMTCVLLGRRCDVTSRKGGSACDWVFAAYCQANRLLFALVTELLPRVQNKSTKAIPFASMIEMRSRILANGEIPYPNWSRP